MIVLHDYWRSSASYRVRIALNLCGEEWRAETVDLLAGDHRSAQHLAINPQGLVPVLEIDDQVFTQSLAQIEYINETRVLGLLPDDPAGRAKVRALAYAIAMEIHPVCNLSTAQWATEQSGSNIAIEDWMHHFISVGLSAYEDMLDGGDYSYGNALSLADICLMPQLYNAERWNVDLSNAPKILRVKENLDAHPAFVAAYPNKP